MARPTVTGLTYFSLDTTQFSDRKIRKLLKKYSAMGYTIYMYLLCEIYRDKGNYIELDNDLIFDIADALKTSEDTVNNVIAYCFSIQLFDPTFQADRKLTSQSIQRRYTSAKRGKAVAPAPETPAPEATFDPTFDLWFKTYDYDTHYHEAKQAWATTPQEGKDKARAVVRDYVASTPDKRYRKHPHKYLLERCYNNEIVSKIEKQPSKHPDYWSEEHARKLKGNDIVDYERHLKNLGFRKITAMGGTIWTTPKKQKTAN